MYIEVICLLTTSASQILHGHADPERGGCCQNSFRTVFA